MGVGIGNSRKYNKYISVSSHNEFYRFLAEQGMLGVISIIILIYELINSKKFQEEILFIFHGFCFFLIHISRFNKTSRAFLIVIFFRFIQNDSQIIPQSKK